MGEVVERTYAVHGTWKATADVLNGEQAGVVYRNMLQKETGTREIYKMMGETPVEITVSHAEIRFVMRSGITVKFNHEQECCESVFLEDITGDIQSSLLGHPILLAEEKTSKEPRPTQNPQLEDSFTWTFYTFRTNAGSVDVRWYGGSNGHYSETVDMHITNQEENCDEYE